MRFAREIVCSRCDQRFPLFKVLNLCSCGSPLLVRYDLKRASATLAKSSLQDRGPTLWRYSELLPLEDGVNWVSLGEGFTPLLEARSLAEEFGLQRLWIKDEGRNPTGSFKDRGLSVAISRAKELGVKKAAIPSAGSPFERWKQQREEKRREKEAQERLETERRVDELLDKVHREGMESLSEAERRFLKRASTKYKNHEE
jgi:hypothetical protein